MEDNNKPNFHSADIQKTKSQEDVDFFVKVEEKKEPFIKQIFKVKNLLITIPAIALILGGITCLILYIAVWGRTEPEIAAQEDKVSIDIKKVNELINEINEKLATFSDDEQKSALDYLEGKSTASTLPRFQSRFAIVYANYVFYRGMQSDAIEKLGDVNLDYLTNEDKTIYYTIYSQYYKETGEDEKYKAIEEESLKYCSDRRTDYISDVVLLDVENGNVEAAEEEFNKIIEYAKDEEKANFYYQMARELAATCGKSCTEKIFSYSELSIKYDPDNPFYLTTNENLHEYFSE